MWTTVGLTPSILILLYVTTPLSVRKLGLRAGWATASCVHLVPCILPAPYPDVRGAGHLEKHVKSQWHPFPVGDTVTTWAGWGFWYVFCCPALNSNYYFPETYIRARKFQKVTSIGQLICEESKQSSCWTFWPHGKGPVFVRPISTAWACTCLWLWNPPKSPIGRAWQACGFPAPTYSLQLS